MNLSNISARIKCRLRREASARLARRPLRMRNCEPLISFTFDDFPRTALWKGGEILLSHGLVGTFYMSLGLMDQDSPAGRTFAASDLPELLARGHELGCHTFDHCDAWETRPRVFENSILENKRALETVLPGIKFKTLSYPISCPRPQTKWRAGKYFACCRGGGQTFNSGIADLNHLNAFFIEQSRSDFATIERAIGDHALHNGWLIFATHDVSDSPTPFGCTPALFEKIVRYSIQSGATILPVSEALKGARGNAPKAPARRTLLGIERC
jgi:peptidoglycan/xylan/chitin deacetylase (PgdA/CDA1 family)